MIVYQCSRKICFLIPVQKPFICLQTLLFWIAICVFAAFFRRANFKLLCNT
jgi:hypothetical protein